MSEKLQGGIVAGSVNVSIPVILRNTSDNLGTTGKVYGDVTASYLRQGGVRVDIPAVTLAAVDSAHSDGGFKEVDSSNMAGSYRFDLPDAACAAGADWVTIAIKVASSYVFYQMFNISADIPTVAEFEARTVSSTAASNMEDTYDGTGYTEDSAPAKQSQLANIANVGSAINTTAESFTITTGTQTLTYTATHELDSIEHLFEDTAGTTDGYYEFDVGSNGIPSSIHWQGFAQGNNNIYNVYACNDFVSPGYQQIGTIIGTPGETAQTEAFDLTTAHVSSSNKVRLRFQSTTGTVIATDRVLCSYSVVARSVGYSGGSIWVKTAGTEGTEDYVNGTADNPCPWANALTLNASLGLNRFHIANGDTITLDAAADAFTLYGENWNLALGGQSIEGLNVTGPSVAISGIGIATVTSPSFKNVVFGVVTIPPSGMIDCGFAGHFTGGSAGQYKIKGGFSLVAGTGSPEFTFTGLGSTTGINVRGWTHEVFAGGKTQIVSNAATVEIRGTTRELDFDLTGTGALQFVGITGLINVSGTTTATLNLHGVSTSITDTSSAATVNDFTQNSTDQNAILADVTGLNGDVMRGTEGANTTVPDAAGVAPTAAEIVAAIITGITDGSYDLQEMMRIMFAVLGGKSDGGGTATLHMRDSADGKNRVTATVDADGNRTAMVLDGS